MKHYANVPPYLTDAEREDYAAQVAHLLHKVSALRQNMQKIPDLPVNPTYRTAYRNLRTDLITSINHIARYVVSGIRVDRNCDLSLAMRIVTEYQDGMKKAVFQDMDQDEVEKAIERYCNSINEWHSQYLLDHLLDPAI